MTAADMHPGRFSCRPDPSISAAQPDCPGQPHRAEPSEPQSGALDRPAKRSYPTAGQVQPTDVLSTPTPMTDPETGCVEHARISEKDSDTPHAMDRSRRYFRPAHRLR